MIMEPGYVQQLPVEILQEIFSNLSYKDLGTCSRVCFKWREIINRNPFWAQICRAEGLLDKECLDSGDSMFKNPTKSFRTLQYVKGRIHPECEWKSHMKKYKFLEKNLRRGNYAGYQLPQVISYYKEGVFLKIGPDNLKVYFAKDLLDDRYVLNHRIKFQHPTLDIERIFIESGFIFYVQSLNIVCLGLKDGNYETRYDVKVQNSECPHINNHDNYEELLIQATKDFLIVIDKYRPCKILFYALTTGCLVRKIEVATYKTCPKVQCLTAYKNKVYVGYTLKNKNHYICEYDYNNNKKTWVCELDYPCIEIMASKNFTTIRLPSGSEDTEKFSELYTYSNSKRELVLVRTASKRVNVLLNNTNLIYSTEDVLIKIHHFNNPAEDVVLHCDYKVNNIMHIMGSLLLVDTSSSVQLWDWKKELKLQTYVNSKAQNIWCDCKMIVWNKTSDMSTYVLAFW